MAEEIEYSDYVNIEVHMAETRYDDEKVITHNSVHRLHGYSTHDGLYNVHEDDCTYTYPIRRIEKIIKTKIKK
jgi:hypothetical protein